MPKSRARQRVQDPWSDSECLALIGELWALREAIFAAEVAFTPRIAAIHPKYRASARNLVHYLALRRHDIRTLQDRLARLGISSLGRAEANVAANLDKVLGILHRLAGLDWQSRKGEEPAGFTTANSLLARHTAGLLGAAPAKRSVRIMVTLPPEAATDVALVGELVGAGMDVARINCAHDGRAAWRAMAENVRAAAKAVHRTVRIQFDLAGPKIRTATLAAARTVLRLRPKRDEFGAVTAPARILLYGTGTHPPPGDAASAGVDPVWLARLRRGDRIDFTDARGASRTLLVVEHRRDSAVAESRHTAYLLAETELRRRRRVPGNRAATPTGLPQVPERVLLRRGDRIHLVHPGSGLAAPQRKARGKHAAANRSAAVPALACTAPEVFEQVRTGDRVWFDDGRIGGVVELAAPDRLEIVITQAREEGEKLGADQGINFPDSTITLPAVGPEDADDLAAVAGLADLIGISFVRQASDVADLRDRLAALGHPDLGIVLKIETRAAFENLPELLFAAMAGRAAGVMIARGDLAVECGFERLAEIQEEILWAAEAAHLPVIWATQVLETLAKTGIPSRAEITDAAMGERAECVMLNKGRYIRDALGSLDNILRRMEAHQRKKRPLLRALRAWSVPVKG